MKQKHVGNLVIVLDRPPGKNYLRILLGKKKPRQKEDGTRKRKRIGIGCWVPPGGGTEEIDKSQKHSAQRELGQEFGIRLPLRHFRKVAILRGYVRPEKTPRWFVHTYLVVIGKNTKISISKKEYSLVWWHPIWRLPFNKMLPGDRAWIPRLVRGEKLSITSMSDSYEQTDPVVTVKTIRSFN